MENMLPPFISRFEFRDIWIKQNNLDLNDIYSKSEIEKSNLSLKLNKDYNNAELEHNKKIKEIKKSNRKLFLAAPDKKEFLSRIEKQLRERYKYSDSYFEILILMGFIKTNKEYEEIYPPEKIVLTANEYKAYLSMTKGRRKR